MNRKHRRLKSKRKTRLIAMLLIGKACSHTDQWIYKGYGWYICNKCGINFHQQ